MNNKFIYTLLGIKKLSMLRPWLLLACMLSPSIQAQTQAWFFQDTHHAGVASDGSFYVVDAQGRQIQQFSPEGDFLFAWDGESIDAESIYLALRQEVEIGRDTAPGTEPCINLGEDTDGGLYKGCDGQMPQPSAILQIAPPQTLRGGQGAEIWMAVEPSLADRITEAWALVMRPDWPNGDGRLDPLLPAIPLQPDANEAGRWAGTYAPGSVDRAGRIEPGFDVRGSYSLAYYAATPGDVFSTPRLGVVRQTAGQDGYEPDDTRSQASVLWIMNESTVPTGLPDEIQQHLPQLHTIHHPEDEDWVVMLVTSDGNNDQAIEIVAVPDGETLDLALELYDADGRKLQSADWDITGETNETLSYRDWDLGAALYYVRVKAFEVADDAGELPYKLFAHYPYLALPATLHGQVSGGGATLSLARVTSSSGSDGVLTNHQGAYMLPHAPGTFTISAADANNNYPSASHTITLRELVHTRHDFQLVAEPVAAPSFSPAAGAYDEAQTVRISSATSGASLRYRTDGGSPSCSSGSSLANGGSVEVEQTLTLSAIACHSGMADSAVSQARYVIEEPELETVAKLVNLSTRGLVAQNEEALVGGFVILGDTPKQVLLRGIGPSLAAAGIGGALPDPMLTLHANGVQIAVNDDWQTSQQAEQFVSLGLDPQDAREAALLVTLEPGVYTATVSGKNAGNGIGMVEIYTAYDADNGASELMNLSTRGRIDGGMGVMIGGFVIQGESDKQLLIKAIGPSLGEAGVSGAMMDPELALFQNGEEIARNDDWQGSAQADQLQTLAFRPEDARESAILVTLAPGAYTATVSGRDGDTGIGMVEVYVME
jgi:hypothetical protein